MSIVAGMDLGYGSQIKVVTSNYLVVNAAASATDTAVSNFLQVVNQTLVQGASNSDTRQKPFQFDYIMCDGNAPATITSPSIIDATGTTTVPVTGPSPSVLGAQADLGAHANSATDIGRSANGTILAILSATGGVLVTNDAGNNFDGFATVNMAGLTDDSSVLSHLQGELLAAQIAGVSLSTIDVTDVLAEIAGETLTAITLSAAVANLNASFVAAGNTAGSTATTINDVTADNNKLGVMSITALVHTAQ